MPQVSPPAWLISPVSNEHNLLKHPDLTFSRSNNNLAITVHRQRLYLAVRSAPHHHPKPPIWAAGAAYVGSSRLHVVSTSFTDQDRSRLKSGWPDSWKTATWRCEFEVADQVEHQHFGPLRARLARPEIRQQAIQDAARLLGESAARLAADRNGYLADCDWREPIFFELNGTLHFLCMQIAGVSMAFEPLRAWHARHLQDEHWAPFEPTLEAGDHFWDVHTRPEAGRPTAYLTLANGGHYRLGAANNATRIDLRCSTDGTRWTSVSSDRAIDRGRACEPALGFAPDGRTAWMLLRLEDADPRGFGSLLGKAGPKRLDRWTFADRADPRRFDSARFFAHGNDLYLVARQNVGRDADGRLDEAQNAPYAIDTPTFAQGDLRSLYLMAAYGRSPKRTALYRLDQERGTFQHLLTLPSAGDTAFPSFVWLDRSTLLLANYSSPPDEAGQSWLEGQSQRTGVFLQLLYFDSPRSGDH
jgi:hypothetical protein